MTASVSILALLNPSSLKKKPNPKTKQKKTQQQQQSPKPDAKNPQQYGIHCGLVFPVSDRFV